MGVTENGDGSKRTDATDPCNPQSSNSADPIPLPGSVDLIPEKENDSGSKAGEEPEKSTTKAESADEVAVDNSKDDSKKISDSKDSSSKDCSSDSKDTSNDSEDSQGKKEGQESSSELAATAKGGDDDDENGKTDDGAVGKKKRKAKNVLTFPKFEVFIPPVNRSPSISSSPSLSSGSGGKSRRFSGSNYGDPTRSPEMSPETTLVEFISTSAGFHGVQKQDIKQLEWDILKVFANNIMPANAAAWYMAKRRYYLNNAWENQLLPFLLKKYPDKFYVRNQTVEFLDKYNKEVARKKLNYMVNQGLYAYFSHKADEYGVYFFDPYYYENTEPFHANLRVATNIRRGHLKNLIPSFFSHFKKQFTFIEHSQYYVSISKIQTKIKINTTGIIVKMIDINFGLIQFPSGFGTEKALFTTKALFTNGWPYQGDPLKLNAVQFDGYRIPGPAPEGREYTWYAVLVWGGRKPSPKFCATLEDLTPRFLQQQQHQQLQQLEQEQQQRQNDGDQTTPPPTPPCPAEGTSSNKPLTVDDSMIIGEVLEIRKNGAILSMQSKDSDEKAIIPGWRKENLHKKGYFLTTTQGVGLAIKDLIGYYLDPNSRVPPHNFVGHQVIVLKHAEVQLKSYKAATSTSESEIGSGSGSPNTRNGVQRQLARAENLNWSEMNAWKMLKKLDQYREDDDDNSYSPDNDDAVDSSDYESFDEADEISDGELNFLRDGILHLISMENEKAPYWRSISYLQKVMRQTNKAINVRKKASKQRPTTPSSHDSGNPTSREVTPNERTRYGSRSGTRNSQGSDEAFWRMKRAFRCLESYNSEEDPSYEPSGRSDGYDTDTDENDNDEGKRNPKSKGRTRRKTTSISALSTATTTTTTTKKKEVPKFQSEFSYWAGCVLGEGVLYCQYSKKYVPNPKIKSEDDEEEDFDYRLPRSDVEDASDDSDLEIDDEEVEALKEDLKEEPRAVPEEEKQEVEEKGGDQPDSAAATKGGDEPDADAATAAAKGQTRRKPNPRRKRFVPNWMKYLLGLPPKVINGQSDVEQQEKASEAQEEKASEVQEEKAKEKASEAKEEKASEAKENKAEEKTKEKSSEAKEKASEAKEVKVEGKKDPLEIQKEEKKADVEKASSDSDEKATSHDEADGGFFSYYDDGRDGEYVPIPIIYDVDLDYDEYSDEEISDDEVQMLLKEKYLPIDESLKYCSCCNIVEEEPVSSEKDKEENTSESKVQEVSSTEPRDAEGSKSKEGQKIEPEAKPETKNLKMGNDEKSKSEVNKGQLKSEAKTEKAEKPEAKAEKVEKTEAKAKKVEKSETKAEKVEKPETKAEKVDKKPETKAEKKPETKAEKVEKKPEAKAEKVEKKPETKADEKDVQPKTTSEKVEKPETKAKEVEKPDETKAGEVEKPAKVEGEMPKSKTEKVEKPEIKTADKDETPDSKAEVEDGNPKSETEVKKEESETKAEKKGQKSNKKSQNNPKKGKK